MILGLLASLIAHAAIFGGQHAMGGEYHGALVQLALAGSIGMGTAFAALTWCSAGRASDGSVLAARLGKRLPSLPAILGMTSLWFALGERIEPEHATASILLTLLSLVVSAGLLWLIARRSLRLLVKTAFSIARPPFAGRVPLWVRRAEPAPVSRRSPLLLRRRFARPPPIAATVRA